MAPNKAKPMAGFMPNVNGTRSATPIVLVKPGKDPTMTPSTVPTRTMTSMPGSKACAKEEAMTEKSITVSYRPKSSPIGRRVPSTTEKNR